MANRKKYRFLSDIIFLVVYQLLVKNADKIGVLSAPATYDQRQEGNKNVRVDLKNVQIFAFVDADYTDYDYSYDYSDLTIKPIVTPTTESTSSVQVWSTWPTNSPSTSSFSPSNSTTLQNKVTPEESSTSTQVMPEERRSSKRCKNGYSPNGKGRCRRLSQQRISIFPFGIKLTPTSLDESKNGDLKNRF